MTDAAKLADEKRLELQSMPDDLMKLAKDQFGPHYLQFEIWVGSVIDKAFEVGKASATLVDVARATWDAGFRAGFDISGEGWNGEYPFGDNNQDPEKEESWQLQRENQWMKRVNSPEPSK